MLKFPTAFISYSWDTVEHRGWVKNLASRLRGDGIDVTLDQWHAIPGDHLPSFMGASIQNNDFVLIICTPIYKEKSESGFGGVKYEGDIITSELFAIQNQRKFIPILRDGAWMQASPSWLSGKYYVDMRGNSIKESSYQDLLTTLKGEREQAPSIGTSLNIEVTDAEMDKEQGTRFLEEEFAQMIQNMPKAELNRKAVAFADIDNLTSINRFFRSEVGDEVLSIVAGIVKATKRIEAFGRCGDDTFYLLLNDVIETSALQICSEINRNIQDYQWDTIAPDLYATCSIGCVMLRETEHPDDSIVLAIMGMLQAKKQGGNRAVKGPKF